MSGGARCGVCGAGVEADWPGPPVYAAIDRLEGLGILREVTGRRRGKLYVYDE
jgi:hypothetical protein